MASIGIFPEAGNYITLKLDGNMWRLSPAFGSCTYNNHHFENRNGTLYMDGTAGDVSTRYMMYIMGLPGAPGSTIGTPATTNLGTVFLPTPGTISDASVQQILAYNDANSAAGAIVPQQTATEFLTASPATGTTPGMVITNVVLATATPAGATSSALLTPADMVSVLQDQILLNTGSSIAAVGTEGGVNPLTAEQQFDLAHPNYQGGVNLPAGSEGAISPGTISLPSVVIPDLPTLDLSTISEAIQNSIAPWSTPSTQETVYNVTTQAATGALAGISNNILLALLAGFIILREF